MSDYVELFLSWNCENLSRARLDQVFVLFSNVITYKHSKVKRNFCFCNIFCTYTFQLVYIFYVPHTYTHKMFSYKTFFHSASPTSLLQPEYSFTRIYDRRRTSIFKTEYYQMQRNTLLRRTLYYYFSHICLLQ